MPLRKDTLYTIHNDLTHTVLDMSDQHVARGWGWHGNVGQQWKLIKGDNDNEWKLLNQLSARYLSQVAGHVNRRLTGVAPDGDGPAEAIFEIQLVPGPSERYRIKLGTSAVTLVTGTGVEQVTVNDVVHDLQTDGPPIILRPVVDAPAASIWSFRPVAKLPLADGTYQIFNRRTGTVLGVAANAPIAGEEFDADHADNTVQGQQSQSDQSNQKWIVTKDGDGDSYTFKNSRTGAHDRFLGTNGAAEDGGVLQARGAVDKKKFIIRKVPDTNYYKIFLAPANDNGVSRLAVNLSAQDQGVYPATLQAAKAETWSFN